MSDTPDFNIKNYSLEDLLELIGAASAQTRESIRLAVNTAVTQFEALQNAPAHSSVHCQLTSSRRW